MKIGFIGTGNMGTALIKGYIQANPGMEKDISAYDISEENLNELVNETGINKCGSIKDVVVKSEILILAVKPNTIAEALKELAAAAGWGKKLIVSVAAGVSLKYICDCCKEFSGFSGEDSDFSCKAVRVMPNTPALVGAGMSALSKSPHVSDDEFKNVLEIFRAVGLAEEVDEGLIDSVVGVSGSAPAYVYMFIESLADGAVSLGMNRKQAYIFAAQAVAGSAEMVLKTGVHPGELKDRVCSPGGTTIEAVEVLEQKGFRSAVVAAVKAAGAKSAKMTK
ncbi:pyrroline-5-carboxylate reductase [Bacillota bacterium]